MGCQDDGLANIEHSYDGKLTLWVPFLSLEDVKTDGADCAVVSEDNYVRLHDQLQAAYYRGVADAMDALRAYDFPLTERVDYIADKLAPPGGSKP